jgi:uncharacterized protein YceK
MKLSLIILLALMSGCASQHTITQLPDDAEKNYKALQLHMLGKRPYAEKAND